MREMEHFERFHKETDNLRFVGDGSRDFGALQCGAFVFVFGP